jgi:hypothetical protein
MSVAVPEARKPAARLRSDRRPGASAGRLLRLELRHNAMMWLLPVVAVLFWLTTYRKTMAMAPMWNLRAASLQSGAVIDFITPVVGAAAWMGTREARRRMTDLVATVARPPWSRLLVTWAATTCWALAGYLGCLAVVYGVTARQASWGGPLWWPVAVAACALVAFSALGFAAGVLIPGRFTAPVVGIASFFVLALSTELIIGATSYWYVSPVVTGPWDAGPDAGVATFYPYLPDLSIAQLMFLSGLTLAVLGALALGRASGAGRVRIAAASVAVAGLLAAGTAVRLAGTSRLDPHGMIAIPALHDAANDRPILYTPVCRETAIPICLNPAYARYLPAVATALRPVIDEVAGLPGAPGRIIEVGATYQQGSGNSVAISLTQPPRGSGQASVMRILLPDQLGGPTLTTSQLAAQAASSTAPEILARVVSNGSGVTPAQQAVWTGLLFAAGQKAVVGGPTPERVIGPPGIVSPGSGSPGRGSRAAGSPGPGSRAAGSPGPGSAGSGSAAAGYQELLAPKGSQAFAVALRFRALPAAVRYRWLMTHLPALRAGQITLAQIP